MLQALKVTALVLETSATVIALETLRDEHDTDMTSISFQVNQAILKKRSECLYRQGGVH